MSGIGRGTKMWFIQMTPLNAGEKPVTSTPHHARVDDMCNDACAAADIGKEEQYAPSPEEVDHVPVTALRDLVKQMGISIGENIVPKVHSSKKCFFHN